MGLAGAAFGLALSTANVQRQAAVYSTAGPVALLSHLTSVGHPCKHRMQCALSLADYVACGCRRTLGTRQRTRATQNQILRMATQMTGCQVSSGIVHVCSELLPPPSATRLCAAYQPVCSCMFCRHT